jgi:hypothetical protein
LVQLREGVAEDGPVIIEKPVADRGRKAVLDEHDLIVEVPGWHLLVVRASRMSGIASEPLCRRMFPLRPIGGNPHV